MKAMRIAVAAAVAIALLAGAAAAQAPGSPADRPFRFSLNMATLRGHKLDIVKQVEIAAQAEEEAPARGKRAGKKSKRR